MEGGVYRQTFHQSFSSLAGLSLSLPDTGTLLVPPGSTTEMGWRHTRGRPDGIPNWFPVPYHQDLCLICPFLLMPPGVEQSSFPGMFPKLRLLGDASVFHVPMHIPEYSPDHSRTGESWRDEQQPRCPFGVSPHQYSKRGGGRLANEEKVIFFFSSSY